MKLVKTASGKQTVKISKKEWQSIGKKAGWMKISEKKCPECGEDVWDEATIDQRLNKCWKCGLKFMNDTEDAIEDNDDDVSRRRSIKVEFSDGDHLYTDINGTKQEIINYYMSPNDPQDYDINNPDRTRTVTNVEFIK